MNKLYKIIVSDGNFKDTYSIKSDNLNYASFIAKNKFIAKYNTYENVKCKLDPDNLSDHIEEVLNILYITN